MRHLAKRHMVAGRSNEDMSWPLGLYSHRTVVRLSETIGAGHAASIIIAGHPVDGNYRLNGTDDSTVKSPWHTKVC